MNIKCVGCYELQRLEMKMTSGFSIVYNCPRYFPYYATISGLIRPGRGIVEAVKDCPQRIDEHCILCHKPPVTSYGDKPIAYACAEHDEAWDNWLKKHPERRVYLAPKGRLRGANWIEVFREFIEDMRLQAEGEP